MNVLQKKTVRADNLNEGFPSSKLPRLPSGARGESNAQKAEFKDFKGLTEGLAKSEPASQGDAAAAALNFGFAPDKSKVQPLPPPNAQAAAALNFGFPPELLHSST